METKQIETPDSLSWYVEQFSPSKDSSKAAEHLVLIPSGEGDCYNLRKIATMLSNHFGYSVTTFDMPGFSRTTGPPEAVEEVTPRLLAKQVAALLDVLGIGTVSIWGSSSGGSTALGLLALCPERVRCAIIHEVPFDIPPFKEWQQQPDETIIANCQQMFKYGFIEEANSGREKWDALGEDYHKRLEKNYVTWIKNYPGHLEVAGQEYATPEILTRRPVFWTVGALSSKEIWGRNWEFAEKAGLKVNAEVLECLHFPHVTIPEKLVDWIRDCIEEVKDQRVSTTL